MREANHCCRGCLSLSLESEVGARQRGQITKDLMSCTKEFGFSPKGARGSWKGSEQERTE